MSSFNQDGLLIYYSPDKPPRGLWGSWIYSQLLKKAHVIDQLGQLTETTRNKPTTSSWEIFISFLVVQLAYDEQGDISVIKSGELSLGEWEAEKKQEGRALKRVFPFLSCVCGLF